jgi:hypothetical protein
MRVSLRLVLLTVGGAALSVASPLRAQNNTPYNGDLIVGFTTGSGNDLVYDLGRPSSLTNGQIWNLNSLISQYDLASVKWGVVGNTLNPGGRSTDNKIYSTLATNALVPGSISSSTYAAAQTAVAAIYSGFPSPGAGSYLSVAANAISQNSWYEQTVSPSLTSQYRNAYGNPNVAGTTSAALWLIDDQGAPSTVLGTFSLGASGVVTYHQSSVSAPPLVPQLSITRNGGLSSILFLSTNGATYTLFFTNHSGLGTSVTNWPSMPGTIKGDGSMKSFTDTTTDADRVYRVGAH